jgi:antitoxin component YwqK of YwqJK toxin-antitoxin module
MELIMNLNKKNYFFIILLVSFLSAFNQSTSKIDPDAKWWPVKCGIKDTVFNNADTFIIEYECSNRRFSVVPFKNSGYHGTLKSWDEAGNLRSLADYCENHNCGDVRGWDSLGNLIHSKQYSTTGKPIGFHQIFYSANHPERFTNFNDSGRQDGWEVFWYKNRNVKDSILFRNDSTIQRTSFFLNGKLAMKETDIYGDKGYNAVSYNPKGKKTGEITNGTGTVFVCDSVGGDCHKLTFKNGKRVFE